MPAVAAMASVLVAAQLPGGGHTPAPISSHAPASRARQHPLLPFRLVRNHPGSRRENSQVQITGSVEQTGGRRTRAALDRREMMVASGAALLLSLGAGADAAHAASGAIETAEEAAANPLIQKLLESSRANKAAYDAARLEDYYKRNFTEYFEFVEGSVRNRKDLTPAEKAIVEWLAKNK